MKTIYQLLIAILFLSSCSQTKKVLRGSEVFIITDNSTVIPRVSDSIYHVRVERGFLAKVTIDDKTDMITIKEQITRSGQDVFDTLGRQGIAVTETQDHLKKLVAYYPEMKAFQPDRHVRILDSKFALQTMAVAFKARPAQNKGNLPMQAEQGITLGFAPGWKFNYTAHSHSKTVFGLSFNRVSLTPGVLLGFGTTDLKKGVSSETIDRKEPIFTMGLYGMLGFNNFNIGFVYGQDRSIGDAGQHWLYNKRWWKGIAVGIDLIK